jgi:hypothetical protein
MRARILFLIAALFWFGAAKAQPVTVIGPITPGDCPQFSSTTIIKDGGFNCNGAAGLVPGVTSISPKNNGGILFDNNGILGDSTTIIRTKLTANTTFYVSSTGSDTGCTGVLASPCATWNHLYVVVASLYDFNGFTVTLTSATATAYTSGLFMSTSWVGGGALVIDGGGSTINETVTKGIINNVVQPGPITIQNIIISSTAFACIQNAEPSSMNIGSGVTLGTCNEADFEATNGGNIFASGASYTVTGASGAGNAAHALATYGSVISLVAATATFQNNRTYTVGFVDTQFGTVQATSFSVVLGGNTITGPRYNAFGNAFINTNGAGANFFPGTSGGVVVSGGCYDTTCASFFPSLNGGSAANSQLQIYSTTNASPNNDVIGLNADNINIGPITGGGAVTATFGQPGAQSATLQLSGSTSGFTAFKASPVASGTIVVPAASGTVAVSATSPISLSATGTISCPTCNTSSANVASVSNSDGTLTISPTTGAVVASIALGHNNIWSGVQTHNTGDLVINGGTATAGLATVTSAGVVSSEANATVAQGGTNCTSASGTCLDNITGFVSTGYIQRTGAGTYTFTASPSPGGSAGGDLTGTYPNPTLAAIITAGGPTGSATVAPIITYDAKGRLTAVSSATITPAIGSITGLGTGIATALAINTGLAGAPVLFNGAGGTPTSLTLTNATGLPYGALPSLSANQLLGALTATTPSGQSVPSCSAASNALQWTSGIGFGCNTSITAASATTATTATTATNATNTAITDNNSLNATVYPTWVTANTGNLPQQTSSTQFTMNPGKGTFGFGANPGAGSVLNITNSATALSGTQQFAMQFVPVCSSSATSICAGIYVLTSTAAASFTTTSAYGMYLDGILKGSGNTITTAYGLYLANQTAGGTNYGLYSAGTNPSFFGGDTAVATHLLAGTGTTPTNSSCGVSPTVSGGDNFGTVVAGTGVLTSCVVNFGKTWGAAPRCAVSSGTAIASLTVTASTTQLTIGGTSLTGDTINWVCGSTASNDNLPFYLRKKFA